MSFAFLRRLWPAALCWWAAAVAAAPVAQGLIVRLRDAPAHERLLQRADDGGQTESRRWRGVLREAGLGAEPALRPVGRDQYGLDFGRLLPADEAARLAERLRRRPEVDWVEPDTLERRLQVPPSDPMFAQQWWLRPASGSNANALADRRRGVPGFLRAWQSGVPRATEGATVAVLDTGHTAHPDLAGRLLPGYDFVSQAAYANDGDGRDADATDPGDGVAGSDLALPGFAGCQVQDSSWHGTAIAAIVAGAANDGQGVAGIQWAARVLPVRVAGKCGAAVSDIIDGMRWAAGLDVAGVPKNANPARVINISFGGSAACSAAYQSAIDELRAAHALVVAAAGNEWGAPTRPASCVGVVGVVALNRDGFKSNYSNFGAALAASGIATVGGDDADGAWGALLADGGLLTAGNAGLHAAAQPTYRSFVGTSFAAPVVAGALGLMLGVSPSLSVEQLLAGLRLSARPHVVSSSIGACSSANPGRCICSTSTCGVGILDAEQALRYAADPAAYVPPSRQPAAIDNPDVQAAAALGADRAVAATPAPAPEPAPAGGGGALTGGWAAALALAVAALSAGSSRRRKARR